MVAESFEWLVATKILTMTSHALHLRHKEGTRIWRVPFFVPHRGWELVVIQVFAWGGR